MRKGLKKINQILENEENCQDLILLIENWVCENSSCLCLYQTPLLVKQGKFLNNDLSKVIEWALIQEAASRMLSGCLMNEIREFINQKMKNDERTR